VASYDEWEALMQEETWWETVRVVEGWRNMHGCTDARMTASESMTSFLGLRPQNGRFTWYICAGDLDDSTDLAKGKSRTQGGEEILEVQRRVSLTSITIDIFARKLGELRFRALFVVVFASRA
jgi:hypothetical protein